MDNHLCPKGLREFRWPFPACREPFLLLFYLATLAIAASDSLSADERFFTYSYEPKVLPSGALEFEQWATLRAGKEAGVFSRWDLRSEFEYGLTDRLTSALYLNFQSLHFDSADDAQDEDHFEFQGLSSEWKFKLFDPTADPVGLLLYGEATTNFQELELEEKLVLGKDLGRTVLALNVTVEEEWEFEREGGESETEEELVLEFTAGAAYHLTDRFAIGLELRQKNVFPEMEDLDHAALFAGPALHYAGQRWWATLTVLPQLVALTGATQSHLDLDEFERAEARLILGINF